MLASRCTGLAIKKLYPIQYWTTKYAEAQPLAEDACSWQYTPDTWTNLHDWRHKHMFTPLKVCNLKFICMGLAIFAGIASDSLLQWITFCQNSLLWPVHLGWLLSSMSYTSPFTMTKQWFNGKTPQYICCENLMNCIKARKIWQQKMSLPGLKASSMLTWTWANSERWWEPGSPGVLQFVGSQRVRHDSPTEQQQQQTSDFTG